MPIISIFKVPDAGPFVEIFKAPVPFTTRFQQLGITIPTTMESKFWESVAIVAHAVLKVERTDQELLSPPPQFARIQ